MIPYFFRHYNGLADRFFIFDNGSTDGSLELLAGDERVSVTHWDVQGDSFVIEAARLANRCWKQSRGQADWVLTAEVDEHLHHPDLPAYLDSCARRGITAIEAIGYDMIADRFPTEDRPLWQLVTGGVRSFGMDKLAIFDPAAIRETNYEAGRHKALPTGRVVREPAKQVRLLHYKFLGAEYVAERNALLAHGIRPGDSAQGWGAHWTLAYDEVAAQIAALAAKAAPVPGLADGVPGFDERELLAKSRLFRRRWYLAQYPDVARVGMDALEHFCRDGWREGRKPNRHFDPEWYRRTYADAVPAETNPLLDYIVAGEQAGRKPAPYFDPISYRKEHRLRPDENALAHYLTPSPVWRTLSRWAERAQKALWRCRSGVRHGIGRISPEFEYGLFKLMRRVRGGAAKLRARADVAQR